VNAPIALIQYKRDNASRIRRRLFSFTDQNRENSISFNIGFLGKKKLNKLIRKNRHEFHKYYPVSIDDYVSGNFVIFQNYMKRKEKYHGNCRG
jgi:hypothetical protein